MIKSKIKFLTDNFCEFVDWLIRKSYLSTPGPYFFISLISFFGYIDSGEIWFILISLVGILVSVLRIQKIQVKLVIFFLWLCLITFLSWFYIGPQSKQTINAEKVCGIIDNIDKNDIGLIASSVDGAQFTRVIKLLNVENELLNVKSFQFICISDFDFIKRSSGFNYSIYYSRKLKYELNDNIFSYGVDKARFFLNSSMKKYYGDYAGVLSAMLFGVRDGINKEDKKLFNELGLGHVLVASGANIISILLIIKYLFIRLIKNWIGNSYLYFWIYLPIVTLYLAIVGMEGSLTRAVIFWVFLNIESLFGRSLHPFGKICLVTLVMLLIFPSLAFSYSFVLSMSAVLGLMIASDVSALFEIPKDSIIEKLISSFFVVFITGFVSGYFFKSINLNGILTNLIFLPIIEIIVISGFVLSVIILIVQILHLQNFIELIMLVAAQLPIILLNILYELMFAFHEVFGRIFIFKTFFFNYFNLIFTILSIFIIWIWLWFLNYKKKLSDSKK